MPEAKYVVDRQFIGNSLWMDRLRKRIHQIANYNYGVLITGPSGTGKELVARAVHSNGNRAERPFIPVNCAAIPTGLFSSQLFGHTKGAFTGAQYASLGCFRAAEGGTLFLDEVGELDLDCQAKLLRVLQEKIVTPVGGHDGVSIDVRTIAATNRDLAAEVRAGRFRLDLYYRLNVLSVETLGLVERRDDIQPLAEYFLAKTAAECGLPQKKLLPHSIKLLESYDWPGNVRELENFIERAVVMTDGNVIGPEAFPEIMEAPLRRTAPVPGGYLPPAAALSSAEYPPPSPRLEPNASPTDEAPPPDGDPAVPMSPCEQDETVWLTLADLERKHIERTLRETYYNQTAAARLLDVDRKLLARKIKKYGIRLPEMRAPRGGQV